MTWGNVGNIHTEEVTQAKLGYSWVLEYDFCADDMRLMSLATMEQSLSDCTYKLAPRLL